MHTENPVEDMKKVINWIYSGYNAYWESSTGYGKGNKLDIVDIMHTENPVEDMKKVINWIYSGYHAYWESSRG